MLKSAHTNGVSLGELLAGAQFLGARDVRVVSCSVDSRLCQAGDLFVALTGTGCDGHDFVAEAVARGASAILCQREIPGVALPQCVVPDTRRALGHLCQALVDHPSRRVRVVGVTGTNGKTTTTALIASILRAAGHEVGTLGTLGYSDGLQTAPASLTTPSAPELASWLARIEAAGCSHAVMEVSSHALALERVAGVEFDVACVTNVWRDHLDFHGTLSEYRRAKARLFEHLRPGGLVVLNADDAVAARYAAALDRPVLTVGMRRPADVTASVVERCRSEQTILISAGNDTAAVRTTMIGDHHALNCLVAAAVGLAQGFDLKTIAAGLEAVRSVPGRLDRIECGQPFGVFVDYAHTPDALATVLDALAEVTEGRLICVFGAGGNRDREKRPAMGQAVVRRADVAIITNDNPRDEQPADIAGQILAGTDDAEARADVFVELDRTRAIHRALSLAEAGDCVLIAGKGHETYQQIGGQLLPLDDRQIARTWLYDTPSAGSSPAHDRLVSN
ncbi:MAG TPA: UDP-N-acetylmuramoyl-L-alanyl-D-glutamate--2,6-diaminopimelate ligase [Pirellulales bacterium]|nr:UDP-N-acetylmuramoyl-L-alanyl-D-glutamate--2,6-diaminopimelate ligase [Pirellulales bacterium]